jgi:hypothetical protein
LKQVEPTDEWKLELKTHEINKYDEYAVWLLSIRWTEREDKLMHDYFEEILNICFDEGRRTNNIDFLNISEEIILLLQEMAIDEAIMVKTNEVTSDLNPSVMCTSKSKNN